MLVDLKSVSKDLVTDGVQRLRLLDDRTYIAGTYKLNRHRLRRKKKKTKLVISRKILCFNHARLPYIVITDERFFAGFPLNAVLVQIGFILLLPCLIVDYRNSPASEAKFNASAIVMALFEVIFVLIAIGGQVQEASNAPHLTVARKRNIAAVLTIIVAIISIIFYRWAFEMTNYVTMLAGCSLYFIIVEDVMKSNYRTGKLVAFIACCLVVSMNDWKLTVDAFKNAKIFWTFLFNCGVHIQLGVLISLQNLLFRYFKDGKLVWQDLWRWRTLAYEIYLIQLFTLVFITLYAPTTTYKIFD